MSKQEERTESGVSRRSVLLSAGAAAGVLGIGGKQTLDSLTRDATSGSVDGLFDETQVLNTACAPNCRGKCPLNVHVRDGQIKFVEPQMTDDEQYRRGCLLGQSHVQRVYSPKRLKYPMVRSDWSPGDPNPGGRGEGAEFEQVSWDEALDYVAEEMLRVREEYGPESVFFHTGSGDNGMGTTIFGRLASMFGGTQQGWSIDSNVGMGFNRVTGHGYFLPPTNESEDWVNANTIIVWGSDLLASQFQNDASKVLDAMENGAKLVVVDPVYTTTAAKADLWLPIKPGKDTHLALAMINAVLTEGIYDAEFLRERTTAGALVRNDTEELLRMGDIEDSDDDRVVGVHSETGEPVPLEPDTYADVELFGQYEVDGIEATTGLTLLEDHVQQYSPETVADVAELDAEDIRTAARWLATRGPGGIASSYALGRYKYGHVFGQTYAILLALTGDYGKSGTIHAQHPLGASLSSGDYGSPEGAEGAQYLRMHEVPDALENGEPYPIKAIYGMESNMLVNQFPDRQRWMDLLENVDMFAMADIHRTPTVQHADILLPAAHWFEREDITDAWGSHPHISYRAKAHDPLWDARDDYYIINDLAEKLGYEDLFLDDKRGELEKIASNDDRFDFDELREKGNVRIDVDVVKYTDPFPTDTGRIEIYDEDQPVEEEGTVLDLPRPIEDRTAEDHELADEYPLMFMQKHSKWRIHSQWADNAMVRKMNPEPTLDVHPSDARERGIDEGDYVRVYNDRGEVVVRAEYNEGMQPGLINIDQGWWAEDFVEGSLQDLTHMEVNDLAPTFAFYDVRAEIEPAPDVDTSMYTDPESADWLGDYPSEGDAQ
ncbi:prokaryotic molybdopterin-containing oxidoreductase family, molybdopterin binding subunit [Halobiforma haloterrestris]|uniref:Prokaryotic molybdopterin-containing oxidoreductase family, molybdopterin binding subunit n=1 Tax=Natronobacterium haloterrestre TaxID=148448 RepID=A0A1I1DEJ3_NATHA|nr:molybdopterin-dependent oxidoreductase [Halobiforma haloterrestris]SFB73234.1 prokaryotic molybdopterin-containing oxidoreductase family, molybdopterin binding subunit [Halobiforma haloterrestris]